MFTPGREHIQDPSERIKSACTHCPMSRVIILILGKGCSVGGPLALQALKCNNSFTRGSTSASTRNHHTPYLSILIHHHIIWACKKYTKKCLHSRKYSRTWSQWDKIGQNFAFIILKSTPAEKKYTTAGCGGCDKYELWPTATCTFFVFV